MLQGKLGGLLEVAIDGSGSFNLEILNGQLTVQCSRHQFSPLLSLCPGRKILWSDTLGRGDWKKRHSWSGHDLHCSTPFVHRMLYFLLLTWILQCCVSQEAPSAVWLPRLLGAELRYFSGKVTWGGIALKLGDYGTIRDIHLKVQWTATPVFRPLWNGFHPWNEATFLIRTFWRVTGLVGVHCNG